MAEAILICGALVFVVPLIMIPLMSVLAIFNPKTYEKKDATPGR